MSKKEEIVEISVAVALQKNIYGFLQAYTKLLGYTSIEDYLKEEIELYFNQESVWNRFPDVYFDQNVIGKIAEIYSIQQPKQTDC